ncbi:MAG: class C beta-lactamase-related serine hydrolase [Planctomycetaceae bacterium]|nr:class C beta-lactamase-related serine hydrolase [Planctomycetaceae bacterium]
MSRALLLSLAIGCCCFSNGMAQTVFPGADWETATPASQEVDAAGLDKAGTWLESHQSKSGLVVRHGRIIAEWYFGDADQKTKFPAYSTTKSFSSLATGLAIEEGKLALDHTVGAFLPDVRPEGKRTITVKQLLSMTSGVHNQPDVHLRDDVFQYALFEAGMDHQPGEKWDYNNTGLALLGPVFQKATGEPLDEFFNQRVFTPIGIQSEDWTWEQRDGYVIPYSGCQLTARAMGRVGLLVLNRGKWKDRQVVPSAWLTESVAASQDLNPSYGYLWWNNTTKKWPNVPKDAFAALGRWDNDILVVPSLDLVVIRQSDLEPAKGHQIAEYFQLVCDAVKKP